MATLVSTPFPIFTDTDGLPLEGGYIDIGVSGLNPLSNPLQAYWDEALTMPATNIRTTSGYPSRNGAAGYLYMPPGDFSILIRNKNGVVILSNLNIIDSLTVAVNNFTLKANIASPILTGIPEAPTAAVETATTQLATCQFVIQNSHVIGELVMSEFSDTPSVGFPALPRNIDQDAAAANWPLLVTKARTKFISVLGVTDHAVTVAASVITFPVAASTTALLALLVADAVVTNYMLGGEIANFLGGATYAVVAAQRSITISAVDYTITAIDTVARTITVSAAPPAGAQNLSVSPYRIAGNATSARFLRIGGFVGVAAGDAGGEIVGGFRKMDRGQVHKHSSTVIQRDNTGITFTPYFAGADIAGGTNGTLVTGNPESDGSNGTPRTGKTNDPRTAGQYAYTWGGLFLP